MWSTRLIQRIYTKGVHEIGGNGWEWKKKDGKYLERDEE